MVDRKNALLDEESCRNLVQQTVRETLSGLGFDLREPNKLQADMYCLRQIRSGSEDIGRIIRRSAITLCFTTTLYLSWEALRAMLQK